MARKPQSRVLALGETMLGESLEPALKPLARRHPQRTIEAHYLTVQVVVVDDRENEFGELGRPPSLLGNGTPAARPAR